MKGLRIFGWSCFGLSLVCFVISRLLYHMDFAWYLREEYSGNYLLIALIFLLPAILSWLVIRALKEMREDLELKMLMES